MCYNIIGFISWISFLGFGLLGCTVLGFFVLLSNGLFRDVSGFGVEGLGVV